MLDSEPKMETVKLPTLCIVGGTCLPIRQLRALMQGPGVGCLFALDTPEQFVISHQTKRRTKHEGVRTAIGEVNTALQHATADLTAALLIKV